MTATDEDGSPQGIYDFAALDAPSPLREELAAAFARSVGPIGPWRRRASAKGGWQSLRHFADFLGTVDHPPRSLSQLTPGMWNDWRLCGSTESMRSAGSLRVRVVLRNAPEINEAVRAAIERRISVPVGTSDPAFSVTELKRLRRAASDTVRAAAQRIEANHEAATSGSLGARERILAEILESGDLPSTCRISTRLTQAAQRDLGVQTIIEAVELLYPSAQETAAMGILLACNQGWNRSVIEEMTVPAARADAQDGAEAALYVADYEKPRAGRSGRHGTVTLASGAGAESLGMILRATEPLRHTLRRVGRESDRLLGYRVRRGPAAHRLRVGLPPHETGAEWAAALGLRDDAGAPLNPSIRRVRKTLQVLDRQPRQNSRSVHNRVYVMSDPAVKAEAASIVAAGQDYALQVAEATLGARIMSPELVSLIDTDIDEAIQATGLSAEVLRDLAAGERDTASAGCIDMHNGPWTQPGELCASSFLLCLGCRNGVVTTRHVPRLVHLRDSIDAVSSTTEPEVWAKDWAEHHARLADVLNRVATPEEQAVARSELSDADRAVVEALLHGRLDT